MCFTNSSLVPPRDHCVALLGIPISWFNDANVLLRSNWENMKIISWNRMYLLGFLNYMFPY